MPLQPAGDAEIVLVADPVPVPCGIERLALGVVPKLILRVEFRNRIPHAGRPAGVQEVTSDCVDRITRGSSWAWLANTNTTKTPKLCYADSQQPQAAVQKEPPLTWTEVNEPLLMS
jgi:hypothetical protein